MIYNSNNNISNNSNNNINGIIHIYNIYIYIETETCIKYEKTNINIMYIMYTRGFWTLPCTLNLRSRTQLLPASVPHSPCTGIVSLVNLVNLALHGIAELARKPRPGIYPNGFSALQCKMFSHLLANKIWKYLKHILRSRLLLRPSSAAKSARSRRVGLKSFPAYKRRQRNQSKKSETNCDAAMFTTSETPATSRTFFENWPPNVQNHELSSSVAVHYSK